MKNQSGVGHIIVVIAAAVVLAIGATSYGVYLHNSAASNSKSQKLTNANRIYHPENVEIKPIEKIVTNQGSVASNTPENKLIVKQEVSYDLTTPYGTLKQFEREIKAGRPNNILSFITPNLMFHASSAQHLPEDGDMSKAFNTCKANKICSLALSSTSFSKNYKVTDYSYPVAATHGIVFSYNLRDVNSIASILYGDKAVRVYFVGYNNDKSWVIDKLELDYYSI